MVRADLLPDGSPAPGGAVEWYANPVSDDGRWVAFTSGESTLVPNDANSCDDVFVRDLATGAVVRVNVSTQGVESDREGQQPAMSADGRFVVFTSYATNLVFVDTNGFADIFLHDRDPDGNGLFDEPGATTKCVSRKATGKQSDGHSLEPAISADGSYVAFLSDGNLDNSNRSIAIYGYDVATGALECLSAAPDGTDSGGDARRPSVSADGNRIAFQCDGPFVLSGDTNSATDVFVRDRALATTFLVSVDTGGVQGDDDSTEPSISGDGELVVFTTVAENLFPNDTNQREDVLLRDLAAGTTELVSRANDGTPSDRRSWRAAIAVDGSAIAFESDAWNLLPNDLNQRTDVFVLDRTTGQLELASETCVGFGGNQPSQRPAISGDGRYVSFFSEASDLLPDALGGDHVYVRDRATPWPSASHRVFGAGWPGTNGIPAIGVVGEPAFGATFDVTAENSSRAWNVGFLLVGADEAAIPTRLGGTMLVAIDVLQPVVLPPTGWIVSMTVPLDPVLCGLEFDLQLIELDPGASKGASFTPGLELIFGR